MVFADVRQLCIFGNLVENALRHSPAGSTVTLGAIDDHNFVIGFVNDEGPGLPEDAPATRLFALFAKGKGERAGKAGLGLYFCKMTVERWFQYNLGQAPNQTQSELRSAL